MKHLIDTQASDVYDKETHDRLAKAAFDWCESVATKFDSTVAVSAPLHNNAGSSTPVDDAGDISRCPTVPHFNLVDMPADDASAAVPVPAPPFPSAVPVHKTKCLPIPVPGKFIATYKPGGKTPEGKLTFIVSIPWDEHLFYHKAKISLYIPALAKVVSTSLGKKPSSGIVSVGLTLPDSIGTDSFELGGVAITSGPKTDTQKLLAPICNLTLPAGGVSSAGNLVAPVCNVGLPVATAVPLSSVVETTLANASAAICAAAAIRPIVVATAVNISSKRKAPAKTPENLPKRKKAVVPLPPAAVVSMSRSGRVVRAASKFGSNRENETRASEWHSVPTSSRPEFDPNLEMHVPDFAAVGVSILATGLLAGVRMQFRATVVKIRPQFPRIVVRYVSTMEGISLPIALPEVNTAYLTAAEISMP